MPANRLLPLDVDAEDRRVLVSIVRAGRSQARMVQRARIVLACAQPGVSLEQVAAAQRVSVT